MLKDIKQFEGIEVTINTTEDCNLRCKYCYEINKQKKDIDLNTAKKFVDLLFSREDLVEIDEKDTAKKATENGVIFDFIGGDSLMNIDILEKIFQYIIFKLYTSDTEQSKVWRDHWRFSLSSNGTLFDDRVKKFLEKYKTVISLGVSVDGCPEIHDKNRIMRDRGPNGEEIGSMQYILKDWEWYKKTLGNDSTKSTLAKDSIPYLYKSLKYMHEDLGLVYINQNFIMEDAGLVDDDYYEFDKQMKECVKYCLENRDNIYWSMISLDTFAKHKCSLKDEKEKNDSKCGSGCMPCLSVDGKIYPCFRWLPHTQTFLTKDKMIVGNVNDGTYNTEAYRRVRNGSIRDKCTREERCRTCEFESACSYCIAGCFAENNDFIRTTHICEITKIQCKWAKVYWNEYNKLNGIPMEFDEKYQLDRVPAWTPEYLGTNKGE